TIQPYLTAVMSAEKADNEIRERAIAAAGMAKAADLLAGKYTLVITNVPYKTKGDLCADLQYYIEEHHESAKSALETAFLDRSFGYLAKDANVAIVLPQNWLFLRSYLKLRRELLTLRSWHVLTWLGQRAFRTPLDVRPVLVVLGSEQT